MTSIGVRNICFAASVSNFEIELRSTELPTTQGTPVHPQDDRTGDFLSATIRTADTQLTAI